MLARVRKMMARITDALGMPIDHGIFEPVVALNALGIHTIASCQGHLNRGEAAPWIEIAWKEAILMEKEIMQLIANGKRESADCKKLQKMLKIKNAEEGDKIVPLLTEFYRCHPFESDRHLTLFPYGHGEIHLMSQGAEYQKIRSRPERAKKLKIYQEEISAFAEFLKEKYCVQQEN